MKNFYVFLCVFLFFSCISKGSNQDINIFDIENDNKNIQIVDKSEMTLNIFGTENDEVWFVYNIHCDNSTLNHYIIISINPVRKSFQSSFRPHLNEWSVLPHRLYSGTIDLFNFDIFLERLENYLIRVGENANDIDVVLNLISLEREKIVSKFEQYDVMIIRENGFVLDYRRHKNFIMNVNISPEPFNGYMYFIHMIINPRRTFVSGSFQKSSPPFDFERRIGQSLSSFDYEIFLERIRIYLIESNESYENTEIIIELLSRHRDRILFYIE